MSFTLNSEFQLRKATTSDYEAVFNINKNVYEGNDYLPEIYEQWIQDSSRDNFVVLSADEVVGFFSLSSYKLDEYEVYVEQALRLRADVLGKSISKDAIRWIGDYIKTKSPKPILLSVSMLFERDYEKAMSKENQDRIQKYIQGSDTRTVLDLGLFTEIKLNEKSSDSLRTATTKLKELSSDKVYEELKKNKFYSITLRLSKTWVFFKS